MKIKVEDNQTLLDIALQHCGTAESMAEIVRENPSLVNDVPAVVIEGYEPGDFWPHIKLRAGQEIEINNSLTQKNIVKRIDKPVATYSYGKND